MPTIPASEQAGVVHRCLRIMMKQIYPLLTLFAFALLGCSNQKNNQVDQIVLMVGSDPYDFEESTTMTKLSQGGGFGVGGEEWGGAVTIFVDGNERDKPDSGGVIYMLDPDTQKIKLTGNVNENLYIGVMFQHFYKWPDNFDGVLIIKEKINSGIVDIEFDLTKLAYEAEKILKE